MIDAAKFETALESYIAGCQKIHDEHTAEWHPNLVGNDNFKVVIEFTRGKRYIKVIKAEKVSRSVHSFIDTNTGDVLKAAGWKAPAKGVRGNILDEFNGLGRMGPYGPEYNR